MNPLSPLIYYRRHRRRTLMLIGLLAMAVMGLYLFVGLMQETFVTPRYTLNRYLSKFSLVQPDLTSTLDPAVIAQIRAQPNVAQVLPQSNLEVAVPNVGGVATPFRLIGLQAADMPTVLAQCGATLIEGRLPQPRTNGIALSQEIATALHLKLGDTFSWAEDDIAYANIVSPLEVVGILSGDVRLGIASYEYLNGHERYHNVARHGVLIIVRPGREAAVDNFLRQVIRSPHTEIHTHQLLLNDVTETQEALRVMFVPIVLLVTAAVTLVIGAVNQLAFTRRLAEFGTLHAVGRSKSWLTRRLTLETTGLAVAGWALGILMSWGGMTLLNDAVYVPKGFAYDPIQVSALLFTAPLPLAVIGLTLFTAWRVLRRMDAVSIVERGALSLEGQSGHARHAQSIGLPRPLASTTFYRRHTRQAAVLISTMALMIVGTALLVFVLMASTDVMIQPPVTALKPMSLISQKGSPLDATMIAQVRAHPAVARAIPVYIFSPLEISIPPMIPNYPVEAYGVTAEDMDYLMKLYGLELAEGHLPRPNTNDIVVPWTIAQNRGLQVGEVIGDRAHPIYSDAPALPSALVVSGIFAPIGNSWLSFSSLEFVNAYRDSWRNNLSLIVVPKAGQKVMLDSWLESRLAGERRTVLTHRNQLAWWQNAAAGLVYTVSLMESIIALVAALALTGLNYLFVIQRQAEFGMLNALGFSRRQLVWRILRESFFTTGIAWFAGLLGCAIILFYLQYGLYSPIGLKLDFFNPAPWLYTLPVPVAVLAVSVITIGRLLSRLDPVSIIERR